MKYTLQTLNEFIDESINESKKIAKNISLKGYTPKSPDFKESIQLDKGTFQNNPTFAITSMVLSPYDSSDKKAYQGVSKGIEEYLESPNKGVEKWVRSMEMGRGTRALHKAIVKQLVELLYKYDRDNKFLKEYAYHTLGHAGTSGEDYKTFLNELKTVIKTVKRIAGSSVYVENPGYKGITGPDKRSRQSQLKVKSKDLIKRLQDKLQMLYKNDSDKAEKALKDLDALNVPSVKRLMSSIYSPYSYDDSIDKTIQDIKRYQ